MKPRLSNTLEKMGCFKMPAIIRDPMKQYRFNTPDEFTVVDGQRYAIINGVIAYHSWDCGTFKIDGQKYHLVFAMQMLDENLISDIAVNQPTEQLDFALLFADFDQMPTFVKSILAGIDIQTAMQKLTQYAQELINQDLANNLDIWDIINLRAGVMDDRYLGRTLGEVLLFKPEIYQPEIIECEPYNLISTDENGEETILTKTTTEVPNITRCSLEA